MPRGRRSARSVHLLILLESALSHRSSRSFLGNIEKEFSYGSERLGVRIPPSALAELTPVANILVTDLAVRGTDGAPSPNVCRTGEVWGKSVPAVRLSRTSRSRASDVFGGRQGRLRPRPDAVGVDRPRRDHHRRLADPVRSRTHRAALERIRVTLGGYP